ncbi:MAG: TrkA family potassium uptake protein [Gaiellales bacterium]|nr:TrkA family potassium uptake protein [Gaiellales bacterium]
MYVVVVGGGKVGSYLAQSLLARGHDVAVIEQRPHVVERLALELPSRVLIIQGDGCDDGCQADAGAAHCQVFAAVSGEDTDNLVACQVARAVHRVQRVVARVNSPKNERIFAAMDIEAISSTNLIVGMIDQEVTAGEIRTLISLSRGDLAIVQMTYGQEGGSASAHPAELDLPATCVLVALVRGEEVIPVRGGTEIRPGDQVIALTRIQDEATLKKALRG